MKPLLEYNIHLEMRIQLLKKSQHPNIAKKILKKDLFLSE